MSFKTYDEISVISFTSEGYSLLRLRSHGNIQEYPQGWIAVSTNAHPERTTLKFQILIMPAKIYDIWIHG